MRITNLIILIFLYDANAFIFDSIDDQNQSTLNMMNFKYSHNCVHNETIVKYINDFREKYQEIQISDDDVYYYFKNMTNFTEICTLKRNKARSVTDFIHHIANECVKSEKVRKRFMLNTLMMLEFELDFVCNLNESVFVTIYKNHVSNCINEKMTMLDKCRESSFTILFFDKMPKNVPWIQLINGAICNFNYDVMKKCAEKPLESCDGAADALSYLLDVIKRNSLCYKHRNVSDIIDSSRDNLSSIVS